MRPILSATGMYHYKLAKWLDEKLKPLSVNEHTVSDIFVFANELREMKIKDCEVLVSYDVWSLFTNIPVDETIESITERAFENDWFNREHDLNITKLDLMELLRIATKNQLFQFEGNLSEQVDSVAMGSPLGPLMANAFMCKIKKQLEIENKLTIFYKRFVDDTLGAMLDPEAASEFLETLNKSHPSIDFTMELKENGRLLFLGMDVIRNGCHLDTTVYRKPMDKGLLLHYHSHVDARYKQSLLNTMLNRAFQLSSMWKFFHEECEHLKEIFS